MDETPSTGTGTGPEPRPDREPTTREGTTREGTTRDATKQGAPKRGAPPREAPVRKKRGKGILWALLAVVVAFLIGFFWQYYEASTVRAQLAQAEGTLQVERLRVQLAQAAVAAQSGEYEEARSRMSDFFTRLQEQQDQLPAELIGPANDALARRDEIITGLSRSNPRYGDVLYQLMGRFSDAPAGPAVDEGPAVPAPGEAVPAPGDPADTAVSGTGAAGPGV